MKYGLIGESLRHSYSKIIYNLLGNAEYELRELAPEEVGAFLLAGDFRGINVTIPYKEMAKAYCQPDEAAQKIGCVNTIVNRGGILCGYNTDYYGFLLMAKRAGVSFEGKKVVALGGGGTSKTASQAARDAGAAEIIIVSRRGENHYGNLEKHADADILINTTPVGMFPDNAATPVNLSAFTKLSAVLDVVYNPLRTRLVLEAKARGIACSGGLSMLAAQALRANDLFFGRPPCEDSDTRRLRELLAAVERRFRNIVLVGMPGCGKSTIGERLAGVLGMDFADTDAAVEQSTGRRIPDIIHEDGEAFFRALERKAVAELSAKTGQVIATGGGSVLLKENRLALAQNGTVVFLNRDIGSLATGGRPLSADLGKLARERLPLYEAMAEYEIEVSNATEDNVRRIVELLGEEKHQEEGV